MIHLGDITKIHGYDAPAVDCIIGGSPCQDLSIAGNRAGLQGERSGLFMEQIRIIKEMRERDKSAGRAGQYVRPRYMVWENVPGAFSSHKGNDFAAVLEETVHIIEPEAPLFLYLKKDGQQADASWEPNGALLGEFSMRSFGESPSEENASLLSQILEENPHPKYFLSEKACRGILTRAARRGKPLPNLLKTALLEMIEWQQWGGADAYTLKIRSGCEGGGKGSLIQTEKTGTLSTRQDQTLFQLIAEPTFCISGNTVDRETNQNGTGVRENGSFTVNTVDRHAVAYAIDCRNLKSIKEASGTLQAAIFDARGNGDGKIVPTITGDHENRITDYTAIAIERQTFNEQSFSRYKESDKCSTLKAKTGNIGNGSECLIAEKTSVAVDAYNGAVTGDKTASLTCKNDGSHSGPLVAEKIIRWIVRRLTPVECERLQGFPDGWTSIGEWVDSKGRKHELKDSPRYKALGNSIAIPSWKWVLKRLCSQYERDATMASLFDGIGGFPLIWEQLNGKGSCLWASEIEEFPIAVTKIHFPEKAGENNG